jgi:transcriptional regulator with XRE-family HTH domain
MTNRLPEKLTALRKHFGYSQGDMAEKLVVPVAEYMNWENGNTICRIDQLLQLAHIYRVPVEDLADNTRTVTLPRLDEDDDSIQISFTSARTADALQGTAAPAAAEETEDFADNLIAKTVVPSEPARDFSNDTIVFQETTVNEIADDPEEEEYGEEEEPEAEEYEPQKPVHRSAKKKSGGSGFNFGAFLQNLDKRTLLAIAGGAAVLVLIIAAVNLLGGRGGSTKVELSDTNRLALGSTYSMYIPEEGKLVTAGQNVPSLDSEGLVQVSSGANWAMGLKKDGTLQALADKYDLTLAD